MWCRVFAMNETAPEPEAFVERLRSVGQPVVVHAEIDEQGWWFHLELERSSDVYLLDRYRPDDLRDDLNTWAAWLEENAGDQAIDLMQRMIGTRQLITMRREDRGGDAETRRFCHEVARWLAQQCDGIYQIDGEGFFRADGVSLVHET
jgi:hypothetical protein